MLVLLGAYIYISFICLVWGNFFMDITRKFLRSQGENPEVSFLCLAGMSLVGGLALLLSLFMPLGWIAHSVLTAVSLIYCTVPNKRRRIIGQIVHLANSFSSTGYLLLTLCTIMVLSISSYDIIHPDTLTYHAQAVLWFEHYMAVPGIAHLKLDLGFQSLWFAAHAIFSPVTSFIKQMAFFLNGAVLCWFLMLVISKIFPARRTISEEYHLSGYGKWGWILLLVYTLVSWTQVRLTAASASPDFIVTLCLLAAFYLFGRLATRKNNGVELIVLVILFGCTAVAVKLSAVAVLLLVLILLLRLAINRKYKTFFFSFCLLLFLFVPLLARNVIATGYPLYPSSLGNIFKEDWKLGEGDLARVQHYISSYARYPGTASITDNSAGVTAQVWIASWWERTALADRLLVLIILLGILVNLFSPKSLAKTARSGLWPVLLVSGAGVALWLVEAPDPRFGTGFLLPLGFLVISPVLEKLNQNSGTASRWMHVMVAVFLIVPVLAYCGWRSSRFFRSSQVIFPSGIMKVDFEQIRCGKLEINRPANLNNPCGSTPVPCVRDSCNSWISRGESVGDGFRERKPED